MVEINSVVVPRGFSTDNYTKALFLFDASLMIILHGHVDTLCAVNNATQIHKDPHAALVKTHISLYLKSSSIYLGRNTFCALLHSIYLDATSLIKMLKRYSGGSPLTRDENQHLRTVVKINLRTQDSIIIKTTTMLQNRSKYLPFYVRSKNKISQFSMGITYP